MSYHKATPNIIKGNLKKIKVSKKRLCLEAIKYQEYKNELMEASRENKKD